MKIDLGRKVGRREFLVRVVEAGSGIVLASAVLTVAGLGLPGCGGGDGGGSGGGMSGVTIIVATVNSHSHSFTIPQDTLDNPPMIGYSASTSQSFAHTHSISLSEDDLIDIANSVPVNGTTMTTPFPGHEHGYAFV